MQDIKKQLEPLISFMSGSDEPVIDSSNHLYSQGTWKHMGIMYPENSEEAMAPKCLLQKHLPKGGTILEIMAGSCDYMYEISKLKVWEMHAMDIIASKFETYHRSINSGINIYNMNIELLSNYDFREKVDVFICHDSWGAGLGDELERQIEEWIWRNFKYILIHMKQVIKSYKSGSMAYTYTEAFDKNEFILDKGYTLRKEYHNHNAKCIDGFSGKGFKYTDPSKTVPDTWTLFKLNRE